MRCMNPKLLTVIVAVGVAVALLAPGVSRSLGPLLIVAACSLSMIVMMAMTGRGSGSKGNDASTLESRPLDIRDAELADLRERLARIEGTEPQAPDAYDRPKPFGGRRGARVC